MKLGITTIQRDREPWIKEWVAFHYLVGFRKFYIFLHNCSDQTATVLDQLKKHFDIKVLSTPDIDNPQLSCYQQSYLNFGDEVDWMAFLDADEFLFSPSNQSIQKALIEYQDAPLSALGVYWSCFGSSGHLNEPDGLIIENYKHKAVVEYPNNRHIKSIVRGKLPFAQAVDPHFFKTPLGTFDENLRPIPNGWTDYNPTYNKFCINHYVTQSRSFFLSFKSKFSTPDGSPARDESYWLEHNTNDQYDNSLDQFVLPLKNLLASQ